MFLSVRCFILLIIAFSAFAPSSQGADGPAITPRRFKFHLINEPSSLRPWEQKNSSSSYLLSQIVGTLLTYQDKKLSGNLAEKCFFKKPTLVQCDLKKNLKWSNSKPLTALHFVKAFQNFVDPKNKAPQAEILFGVKNAKSIFLGQLPPEKLGVEAKTSPASSSLFIKLEEPDIDFLYNLSNSLLAPLPDEGLPSIDELKKSPKSWISSGSYMISSWNAPEQVLLSPNTEYWKKNQRPPLEISVIGEDSVALNLYEKDELDFLRRLPTLLIPKYKDRSDFFQIEQYRFDYIGFSPKFRENLPLRRSIGLSINFKELQNLFHSPGLPGCPGVPSHLVDKEECLQFDLVEASSEWSNLKNKPNKIEIIYSKQGGDDHRRSMEWLQSELKKNLKLNSEASSMDNQIFLERLSQKPGDVFRKGLAPSRPTCSSALKAFQANNPENFIQFSDPKYETLISQLGRTENLNKRKKLCSEAIHILLKDYWLIPTGPIHFTLLAKSEWKNWKLNELNQLDLSELELR